MCLSTHGYMVSIREEQTPVSSWAQNLHQEHQVRHGKLYIQSQCCHCVFWDNHYVPEVQKFTLASWVSCHTSQGRGERKSTWPGRTGSIPGSRHCFWSPCEKESKMTNLLIASMNIIIKIKCWLTPLSEGYLSYILIALFNVFCSTDNQLMNIVYLCFLYRRENKEQWVYWRCSAFKRLIEGNKTKRGQLTCCRTFSAKISCSREISTTFPSICLPSCEKNALTSWIKMLHIAYL